ncbi:MAG: hypothetical protein OEZ07_03895, partial [Dehalococcoidia bacterium]|nr:hypothetical protein [Dehalococcoidia bacterium]
MPRAKRRTAFRPKQKRTKSRPARKGFFSFAASSVVRRLILVVVIIALLYLFAPSLATWGTSMLTLFGLGLVITAIALGVIIWVIWGGHFSASVRRWNWFFGGALLALAIWGALSFFSPEEGILSQATLGGKIGQRIIGTPNIIGGL